MYLGTATPDRLSGVLFGIPSGVDGVRATLAVMRAFVRNYRGSIPIMEKAAALTQHLPQKAWSAQVRALHRYVRDGIRYIKDPVGIEKVQTPTVTMEIQHGDCDDKATLLAALLESIGHPARFVAVGFEKPGDFSHVYVETKIGNQWVPLETTTYVPAGMRPPRIVSRMTLKV